jgi:hypothetical protein
MITVLNQKEIDIISGGIDNIFFHVALPILAMIVEESAIIAFHFLKKKQNGDGGTPV